MYNLYMCTCAFKQSFLHEPVLNSNPNSGSSLRKVLRLNLSRHMDRLGAISVSATREHGLELTLREMKEEWGAVDFTLAPASAASAASASAGAAGAGADVRVLVGVEDIQSHMDDHRIKTQNMRGSPYFKAFEGECGNHCVLCFKQ